MTSFTEYWSFKDSACACRVDPLFARSRPNVLDDRFVLIHEVRLSRILSYGQRVKTIEADCAENTHHQPGAL